MEGRWLVAEVDGRATPKIPATEPTKNPSPTYYPEIQGWDLCWLELLEWLEEGHNLVTNSSSQLKSQPYIPKEYVGLVFLAGSVAEIFGVALV